MNGRTAVQARLAAPTPAPVQAGLLRRKCACGTHTIGGECDACGERYRAHAPEGTGMTEEVSPIVHETLRSSGQPLDVATRSFMESRFGHDFSRVRVHTDAKAAQSAQAVNAIAFTVGRHIVFGNPHPRFDSSESRQTMAHELAHTIQQNFGDVSSRQMGISSPSDASEREAEFVAADVVQRRSSEICAGADLKADNGVSARLENPWSLGLSKSPLALQRLPASTPTSTPASFYQKIVFPYKNATPLPDGTRVDIEWHENLYQQAEAACLAISKLYSARQGVVSIDGGCAKAMDAETEEEKINAVWSANGAVTSVLNRIKEASGGFCGEWLSPSAPASDAAGLQEWKPTITVNREPPGVGYLPPASALSIFPRLRPKNNVKVKVKSTT
jgi:hypothetical protein